MDMKMPYAGYELMKRTFVWSGRSWVLGANFQFHLMIVSTNM